VSKQEIETARHCLQTVVSCLNEILDDSKIMLWTSGAGKPWESFDEFHQTLADDMDLELWGQLLDDRQRRIYQGFLDHLNDYYGSHKMFTSNDRFSADFTSLRASAKQALVAITA
jgi:hypothetical protein